MQDYQIFTIIVFIVSFLLYISTIKDRQTFANWFKNNWDEIMLYGGLSIGIFLLLRGLGVFQ